MNLVDVLIILALFFGLRSGLQHGFLKLAFSLSGFVVGLIAGSWLAGVSVSHIGNPGVKLILLVTIELFAAFSLSFAAELAALKLTRKAHKVHASAVNQGLGAAFEVAAVLLIAWLIASSLANVRAYSIGPNVRKSLIVRSMNSLMPPPPSLLTRLEKLISPNGFPDVFIGLEPQHTTVSPNSTVKDEVILKDEQSVVKIQGVGCGGIIFGSGFVVDKGFVVTNAHVVAGVQNPKVVDSIRTYDAAVVLFDPNLDLAILRVNNLPDAPIPVSAKDLSDSAGAVIIGFPGGEQLIANRAVVIDKVIARGKNIYNQGTVLRTIYEIQGDVEKGNSGGPLIGPDGSAAGVIFAKSVTQGNVGYALTISAVKDKVQQAEKNPTPVSTRSCAEG